MAHTVMMHACNIVHKLDPAVPLELCFDSIDEKGRLCQHFLQTPRQVLEWLQNEEKNVARDARHLGKIVQTAIRWARMRGKTIEAHFDDINLYTLLLRCVDGLKADIADQFPLRVHIQENIRQLPLFVADPVYMELLFTNLIDNAIKYSWNPGVKHEYVVKILGSRQAKVLDVQIVNWGLGIAESDYEKIFASFYRSSIRDSKHSVRGVGLGLATCLKIVRIHRGSISVRSRPTLDDKLRRARMEGYETTFTVRIPTTLIPGRVDVDATSL